MKISGYMYKCDMCGHEQFVSIEEQNDGLLKVGIHKFELAGNSELKHICHDCYTALIHFIRVEHKDCGVTNDLKSNPNGKWTKQEDQENFCPNCGRPMKKGDKE